MTKNDATYKQRKGEPEFLNYGTHPFGGWWLVVDVELVDGLWLVVDVRPKCRLDVKPGRRGLGG